MYRFVGQAGSQTGHKGVGVQSGWRSFLYLRREHPSPLVESATCVILKQNGDSVREGKTSNGVKCNDKLEDMSRRPEVGVAACCAVCCAQGYAVARCGHHSAMCRCRGSLWRYKPLQGLNTKLWKGWLESPQLKLVRCENIKYLSEIL